MTAAPPQPRSRTWFLRLAAGAIGLVMAVLLVEAILRVFHLAPVGGIATVNQRDFDRLPGLFVPGQHMLDRRVPALPHEITIDSLGYRGTEALARAKPVGAVRIVLLGDSFTYGDFVDDSQTLPALLEQRLRTRCGNDIEVINAGVGGSSIETAAVMAERSLVLGVDIAVLTFSENDVTDLAAPMWDQMTANRAAKSRFPMSVVYPVMRRLAVWNLMLTAQSKLRNRRAATLLPPKPKSPTTGPSAGILALRDEYQRRLVGLRDQLGRADIPLVFAIYPSHLSVYRINAGEQIRWIEATAVAAGLETVNFMPVLQEDGRPVEELYLLPHDGHPSARGYAVVAPSLEGALVSMPALATRCNPESPDHGAQSP